MAERFVRMPSVFDVVVAGLGAAGSAAAATLARRGVRVLGLDRRAPPHTFGSTHGESRIVRRAYFEGRQYLPLLARAWQLWQALEDESGQQLITRCGVLAVGRPQRAIVGQTRRSAVHLQLLHAVLTPDETRNRFPAFHVPDACVAVLEPDAGLISPEAAVRTYLRQAARSGASLHVDEPVLEWRPDGRGVAVTTAAGTYGAQALVLAIGGWTTDLLGELRLPLAIERVTNVWIRPRPPHARFSPTRCPAFLWEHDEGSIAYGVPDLGHGVKAGFHGGDTTTALPDELDRTVSAHEADGIRVVLQRLLPECDGPLTRSTACFYTCTPDRHYLIDRHPAHPQVVYASACSGHGFKASPAVGEALADLVLDRAPAVDLSPFRFRW